jgi:hypothetical protein
MNTRFQDTASAYRLHRAVTNEADAISAAIGQYVGDDLGLLRNRLRVLDAGTGDGRVLKGAVERLLRVHCHRPCEMVLKEYDFHHIEALLQTVAPLLHHYPGLTLYVTNRTFRQLRDFHHDVGPENTVCFDRIAGYRLLAMAGTASLLKQENSLRFSFPNLTRPISDGEAILSIAPLDDLWGGERALYSDHFLPAVPPALKALGDEIRAREIYDELAAARGASKQFTVTVTRQNNGVDIAEPRDCFWDLAIVSHAFNRDKDPGWICRNILSPLCQGLSIGGVLVNVHAVEGGQVSELRREIFGDEFSFRITPAELTDGLAALVDFEQFEILSCRQLIYQAQLTAGIFNSLEPWQRELALQEMAISAAYHLQVPDDAWIPQSEAIQKKIHELIKRDGGFEYALSLSGVKRRE